MSTPDSPSPGAAPQPPPPLPVPKARVKRGAWFWVTAILAGFFFISTLVLLLLLMVLGAAFLGLKNLDKRADPEKPFTEKILEGSGDKKILVISVKGVITDHPGEGLFAERGIASTIRRQLDQARSDPDIEALIVDIDSPGGGITASDIIHREVLRFREQAGKKVVALINNVGASGGYYVATAADRIIAHPTSITGSIGVIATLFSAEELLKKIGVKIRPIKSADKKDIGAPYRSMTDPEREQLQAIVDKLYDQFVKVVHQGMKHRGVSISRGEVRKLADGSIFTGEQAEANRLVDQTGYYRDAVAAALALAGLDEAKVVTYRRPFSLRNLLSAQMAATAPRAIKVEFGDARPLDMSPFMYLWMPGRPTLKASATLAR